MPTSISTLHPTATARQLGAHHHDHTWFHVPRDARLVKDIFWLAVVGMTLAGIAILSGAVDPFVHADLLPLTLGSGLGSITFSLLGLTDRLSGRS